MTVLDTLSSQSGSNIAFGVRPESKALLIVETPFQLLCAYEVISVCRLDYTLLLRVTGAGRNDQQLLECASILGLSYSQFRVRVGHHRVDALLAVPAITGHLLKRYDHLFVGSYFSRLLMSLRHVVRNDHLWLLDDGVSTFLAQDKMAAPGRQKHDLATFFRVPPLPGQTVVCHQFSSLAALSNATYADTSLFIGQPQTGHTAYPEYRAAISRRDYFELLARCRAASPGPMLYIPHRVERSEDVEEIGRTFNVDVQFTSVCIELHLVKAGSVPRRIYTSISTAAFSLAAIFPDCTVTMFPSYFSSTVPHLPAILSYAGTIPNIRVSADV